MNPEIVVHSKKKDILLFTISHLNVSFANALRRIIIADIPTVIIRSFPYKDNDITIHINTSRLNNEILKQRLSCIPIHINRPELSVEELREYEVELEKKNTSNQIEFITTGEFKIKHKSKYLADEVVHKIFPPDSFTKDYILFARLRPKISDDIPGEELKLSARLSRGTAKENSMFNVVSTCSYAMTPNQSAQYDFWKKQEKILSAKGIDKEDLALEKENWLLGEGKRIYIPDSFDFTIETLGVFSNIELIHLAIEILNKKLMAIQQQIEDGTLSIQKNQGTANNSFDITLVNEDYTIGKVLEYILHQQYYSGNKTLSYIGFLKQHPHDVDSIIRMIFKENIEDELPIQYLSESVQKASEIFTSIDSQFN